MCSLFGQPLRAANLARRAAPSAFYGTSTQQALHRVSPGRICCAAPEHIATFPLRLFTSGRSRSDAPSHSSSSPESPRQNEDKFMYLQSRFSRPPTFQPLKEADSIGTTLLGVFIALFGVTFACVPLYEFFCQQSGYMGTTKRVKTYKPPPEDRTGRMFEIDFVTHSHLKWDFKPAQRKVVIGAGETTLAFYTAKNLTDKPVIGVAAYHVIPDEAGGYFNKIQCFCFEEQMLHPGEEVDLPVLFFLDPDILKDKRLFDVDKITLTYTFFEANSEIPPEYTTLFNRNGDSSKDAGDDSTAPPRSSIPNPPA